MIKKLAIIFFLASISYTSQSQVLISLLFGEKLNSPGIEFGLEGGLNYSTISGFESNSYLGNFYLGFYFDIRLKEPTWWLSTGVMVKSGMGIDKLTHTDLEFNPVDSFPQEGDYSQRIKYFLVPVMVKYKFKNSIFIELGVQAGLRRKDSYIQFDSETEGLERRIQTDNHEDINPIDVGGIAGVGYTLFKGSGLTLALKYYYGFANTYKGVNGKSNRSFFLQFNVPIGAGKKNIKQNE